MPRATNNFEAWLSACLSALYAYGARQGKRLQRRDLGDGDIEWTIQGKAVDVVSAERVAYQGSPSFAKMRISTTVFRTTTYLD